MLLPSNLLMNFLWSGNGMDFMLITIVVYYKNCSSFGVREPFSAFGFVKAIYYILLSDLDTSFLTVTIETYNGK